MMHKALSSIEEGPYCFPRSSVKFQGHTAKKIVDFDLNWEFPDCNSSLNSQLAMKWRPKRCPIVFQGHPSNFKVTWVRILLILTWIERFRTVTQVSIHRWLWNDAQSLMQYRRGALSFFKVIRQISRSRGQKNRRFWPELRVSGL